MNKVTQSIYKKKVDELAESVSTLYLHSIKIPAYSSYAVMSVVLPFDTPITKDNFQDLLLPFISVESGPTTHYPASGQCYYQVQGSQKTFWVIDVSLANKNYGTTIQLQGLGLNASNVVTGATYNVTDELTDVVKELV